MKRWIALLVLSCLMGCGKNLNPRLRQLFQEDLVVVRSRAEITVTTGPEGRGATVNQPVTVTNVAAVTMTLDNSAFVPPTITNAMMDFGNLTVGTLLDNSLSVCGAGGNQKCGTALLRVFTTGVAGTGLFNSAENYGVPLTASLNSPLTVGLEVANAVVMQTFTIPASKRVLRLRDFTPAPVYNMQADFTDAGTGTFSTTIVIEYALTL